MKDEVAIDGEEELEPLNNAVGPKQPTGAQVEDHWTDHFPFRT